jgi:hypothetical protein
VAPASSSSLPLSLPTDCGVYVLSNAALSQLQFLPEQVPDMRVAISTPIKQPSRTTLPDGKAKFIVFRRDLAGNAPDQIEVRVVAWVARALTFDAKAKPSFSPVSDAWNIRNISLSSVKNGFFQTGSDFDCAKSIARMRRKKSLSHLMRRRKL